jgi:transketolase
VASELDSDLFDYTVYCLAGDGCLQEGISAEASSLAGHLKLNNLVLIYDDNKITIDGATDVSFTESVVDRYRAYGWNVLDVAKNVDGSINVVALNSALEAAKASKDAPTLIRMESEIAWPAPKLRNTAKSHGSALGADEVAATKRELGLDPAVNFFVDEEALAHARTIGERGASLEADWNRRLAALATTDAAAYERWLALSKDIDLDAVRANLPSWEIGSKVATRKASQKVLNALAPVSTQLLGGSADLSESNGTWLENHPPMSALKPAGRNIHFGIREHAMGGIANGLTLAGLRPYVATFLVFSDYMRASVRLSALMDIPTTYVWTHDSIGLGEDGPTHQPVEHLASLRLIPNFAVVRPADGNETAAAWQAILSRSKPAGIVLSRQDLTTVTTSDQARNVARGGYVVRDAADAHVTLIATGSELELALAAAQVCEEFNVRVVSMPCVEWFLEQDETYQASVLPAAIPSIAIEAGSSAGWYQFVGRNGAVIGLDKFGASAAPEILFERNGFSVAHVLSTIRRVVS